MLKKKKINFFIQNNFIFSYTKCYKSLLLNNFILNNSNITLDYWLGNKKVLKHNDNSELNKLNIYLLPE